MQDVKDLVRRKGLPAFTAKAVDIRGHLLAYRGLDVFDCCKEKTEDALHGQVLLYCKPWDGLWLWSALPGLKMRQATPFLGRERPGAKFLNEIAVKNAEPVKLIESARVWLVYVDEQGIIRLTTEMTVSELASKE